MSSSTDTNTYLEGLSALAAQGFASIQIAVDAILQLMTEHLGMRSSFLAHIKFEDKQLEVLAVHNAPGGCDILVGTAVPLSQGFSQMMTDARQPSPVLIEKLQQPPPVGAGLDPPSSGGQVSLPRIGCYIGVPIVLTDGTFFGALGAADPEPQKVQPQQPAMLAVLARRLANEIERDYEQTQRKRAQAKLAKAMVALSMANKQLEQMNKLKSDFISIVGHEFRTALTSIRGFSEMMCDEDFSVQEMKEFAADIQTDTMRLNRMISDMLDLDRMESGRVTLHPEQVDLNAIIKDVAGRIQPTAPKHALRLQLDDTLPEIVGDSDKLIQVLTNLVSNAVKYSPEGGEIHLSTRVEGDVIHVQIQDQGVGIPADSLEQVFERYSRIEAGTTRYIKGTGLGLAIVRQIVQMHGGKVWVESILGEGSVFHVTLPLIGVPVTVEKNNG